VSGDPHVMLVEDDGPTADAIQLVLRAAGFEGVTALATAGAAERAVAALRPGILIVDLGLPDRDGVELIAAVRAAGFAGHVLVLTSATAGERILAALDAGADGYLFKDEIDVRLAASLRDLVRGGAPLSSQAARVLLDRMGLGRGASAVPQPPAPTLTPPLTPKERAVLELLATGGGYSAIAAELGIQLNTVRSHIRSLYDKLGVENRAEAVNLAWNSGLLRGPGDPHPWRQ
jgi:DNA-binding NarL/FixJ family response regulator